MKATLVPEWCSLVSGSQESQRQPQDHHLLLENKFNKLIV